MAERQTALNYLDIALVKLNGLTEKRRFWLNYLIILGFFDIAFSILQTNNNDNNLILAYLLSPVLFSVFGLFVLSILSGKEKVLNSHKISLILRTIAADFFFAFIVLIGSILFIIPGIILGMRYIYIKEAILIEGLSISQAYSRSRYLSSFNGGRIFKSLLIFTMIWFVILGSFFLMLYMIDINLIDGNNFLINYLLNFAYSMSFVFVTSILYSGYTDACQNQS